jgi:hypothetical protein
MANFMKLIAAMFSTRNKTVEYILQTGFSESLRKKAVVIDKKPRILYAWKCEDVKQLFDWLTIEDYIVLFVGVLEILNKTPDFLHESWIYIGDRTCDFDDSKKSNRLQSLAFIEKMNLKKPNALFEVFFESTKSWDPIRIEFFNREINSGGELAYTPQDTLDVIDRCRQLGKKILGFEAFIIRNDFIQPQDYFSYYPDTYDKYDPTEYFKQYHIKKNTDIGHWEEAKQYVRDRADNGWVFEIDYEK